MWGVGGGGRVSGGDYWVSCGKKGRRLLQDCSGAGEGVIEGGAEIGASDGGDEAGLLEHFQGLTVDAAWDDGAVVFLEAFHDAFESGQAGGVHGRDEVETEDEDFWKGCGFGEGSFHFFSTTEKEGTEDSVDQNAGRNVFALGEMFGAFEKIVGRDLADLGCFGDSFDEEDGGEDHADLDRYNEIEDDG